jgi:hypothetical protein
MAKLDLKKVHKNLFSPKHNVFSIVDVPALQYLMVDGKGNPNTAPEFIEAVSALYGVAYTTKFMLSRRDTSLDYGVAPLEGLWWADDMSAFCTMNKDDWKWTMMILQPDFITKDILQEGIEIYKSKKKITGTVPVRLETLKEGKAVQTLYLGAYKDEAPTIKAMHEFIAANGLKPTGKHHEIYLGDPKRVAPEKLKTILRQPVK